jgi:hypothetical protein
MFAFNYTPHIETQNVELVITFVTTNIMPKTNYKSHKPQNGPTLHEHVAKGFHVIMHEPQFTFMHMPTCVGRNYFQFPLKSHNLYAQHDFVPYVLI